MPFRLICQSSLRVAHLAARSPSQAAALAAISRSRCFPNYRFASTAIVVPEMAESITEGTLKQFSKKVGDRVEIDEEIATIETDKIDVAVNSTVAGTIVELLVSEDSTVTVGQEVAKVEPGEGGAKPESKPAASEEKPAEESKAAPKEQPKEDAKKPAKQETPPPSQPKAEPKAQPAPAKPSPPPPPPQKKQQTSSKDGEEKKFALWTRDERRVKMNRMRLRIAERLKQAQNTAASLTTFQEVDMSSLVEFRQKYKDETLKKTGIKIGFMGAFARACTLAMKDIPSINAAIEGPNGGDTIVYHDYVDISVAVATEKGLTTPIVRNVESMNLLEIERVISDLGKKARDSKLTIEDMAGGTFTISNGGVFGSLMSTPIINPPQAAVLGLHAIFNRAVPVGDKFEMRPMMNIALTYDHRLIDGREAATFLVKVKEYIQDPRKMLLG